MKIWGRRGMKIQSERERRGQTLIFALKAASCRICSFAKFTIFLMADLKSVTFQTGTKMESKLDYCA
jgi:hypothetical protein